MKNLIIILVLLVSNSLLSQNSLHDTILEQPYRNDTITDDFFDAETVNSIIIELVNNYRVANGLNPLMVDTTLMRLSNNHAKWMATTRIYCHLSDKRVPNHTDHKKYNFAENCMMYNSIYLGDTHFTKADMAVGAWLGSPGHLYNILDPSHKYIGAGSFQKMTPEGQKGQYFVLQLR
jgi:uncharacterized protein YkwD